MEPVFGIADCSVPYKYFAYMHMGCPICVCIQPIHVLATEVRQPVNAWDTRTCIIMGRQNMSVG